MYIQDFATYVDNFILLPEGQASLYKLMNASSK